MGKVRIYVHNGILLGVDFEGFDEPIDVEMLHDGAAPVPSPEVLDAMLERLGLLMAGRHSN